jgi:hypothetical protein
VVKYVRDPATISSNYPLVALATLTIIRDDCLTDDTDHCPSEEDGQTVLLEFTKDNQPRFFATVSLGGESIFDKVKDFQDVKNQFLSRLADDGGNVFAGSLRDLFKPELCTVLSGSRQCTLPENLIPVIKNVGEPFIRSDHSKDKLGSVLRFQVDIGFAFQH